MLPNQYKHWLLLCSKWVFKPMSRPRLTFNSRRFSGNFQLHLTLAKFCKRYNFAMKPSFSSGYLVHMPEKSNKIDSHKSHEKELALLHFPSLSVRIQG